MIITIADEGGREISEMLKLNQNIRKLLLSSNLLGDVGVKHLAEALSVNTGLELLLIADNPFGDDGGRHLTEVLCHRNRSLRVLDIHGTRMSKAVEREVCTGGSLGVLLTEGGIEGFTARRGVLLTEYEGSVLIVCFS